MTIIRERSNETLTRFHADCYESYFNSANKYHELAESADWIEPVRRYFQGGEESTKSKRTLELVKGMLAPEGVKMKLRFLSRHFL